MDNLSIINPYYAKKETISQLKKAFQQHKNIPEIQLQQFFTDIVYAQLQHEIHLLLWQSLEKPLYSHYASAEVSQVIKTIISNQNLLNLLIKIIDKKISIQDIKAYQLSWKNYSLLHDKLQENTGFDLIIDFTEAWSEQAGGNIIYTNGINQSVTITPAKNAITLIERKKSVQKFFQYCNHYSKGRERKFIVITFHELQLTKDY